MILYEFLFQTFKCARCVSNEAFIFPLSRKPLISCLSCVGAKFPQIYFFNKHKKFNKKDNCLFIPLLYKTYWFTFLALIGANHVELIQRHPIKGAI
jgi:hypothetical protein